MTVTCFCKCQCTLERVFPFQGGLGVGLSNECVFMFTCVLVGGGSHHFIGGWNGTVHDVLGGSSSHHFIGGWNGTVQ